MKNVILSIVGMLVVLFGGSYLMHVVSFDSWLHFPLFMTLSLSELGFILLFAGCLANYNSKS